MISGPWNPGFQDSRSALELASFDWFQHIGYESHSVYVKKLYFEHRISKLIIPGNFQKFPGTLDITWKWPFFANFDVLGINSTYFLSLNMNFASKIEKCHVLDVFRCQLSKDPKIARNLKNCNIFQFFRQNSCSVTKFCWIDAQHIKIGKKWPLLGDIQGSRKFLEVSRNDEILKFCIQNQVSWHKLSGIHTLYVEISQN